MMTKESKRGVAYVIGLSLLALGIQIHVDTGKVIDGATGEPLADVHVISRWNADWFAGVKSSRFCFKIDSTRTTEKGRFTFLSNSLNVNPMMSDRVQTLIYYKPGYEMRVLAADFPRETIALVRDTREGVARLEGLVGRSKAANCWIRGKEPGAALAFFRDVYKEAMNLGRSRDELLIVNFARGLMEAIEAGRE